MNELLDALFKEIKNASQSKNALKNIFNFWNLNCFTLYILSFGSITMYTILRNLAQNVHLLEGFSRLYHSFINHQHDSTKVTASIETLFHFFDWKLLRFGVKTLDLVGKTQGTQWFYNFQENLTICSCEAAMLLSDSN